MNVLLIMLSKESGTGGMEKHCQELANGLSARGIHVTCAAAGQHQSQLVAGVKKIPLNTKPSRFSPRLLLQLVKIIRNDQFDIVHAQGSKAAAALQLLAPLLGQTKLIATIHGFKSTYPKATAFSGIIAVSKKLGETMGHPNVSVVYNGISPMPAMVPAAPLPAAKLPSPVWLAVGRLVPAKGFDFLIDAFQHASGTLLIAGAGPEQEKLAQQIQSTSQAEKIKLLGQRDDIPALMAQADGVVISSRREGFSYVFAEALLAGKPVIATDVPIANEFLEPAYIHSDFNPETFGRLLSSDTEMLLEGQRNARVKASNLLSLESMVENTLHVYRQCLDQSG
jgi:glycosyltransferase involved in cell wall biosynthesis